MNKKANPRDVRNINQTFRLNKKESELLLKKAKDAEMKLSDFLRKLVMDSIVIETVPKKVLEVNEKFLAVMLEYRNNFRRLSSLIKAHDPSLNFEIEVLVRSIQNVINQL